MKKILSLVTVCFLLFSPIRAEASCSKFVVPQNTVKFDKIDNLVGNYPNEIKLIFSDIDGTILRFNKIQPQAPIPQTAKRTILELKNANVPLILVTGRSYFEAKSIADELGNDNIFIITDQGALIWNQQGELVFCDPIKYSDVIKIYKNLMKLQKKQKMAFGITFCTDKELYSLDDVKMPYNWQSVDKIKSIKELSDKKAYVKIVITEPNQKKLRIIEAFLKKKFPNYKVAVSTDCYCDIGSANANKGEAVRKVAEKMGVDLKNVAVFGDAENDSSMLDIVKKSGGASIAVRNAMPSLIQYANYKTKSVQEGGFSYGVDKILKNNARLYEIKK